MKNDKITATSSVRSYTLGFTLSIMLTASAYTLVSQGIMTGWKQILALALLAILQLLVQLIFFLHLGIGKDASWNVIAFIFMITVVAIIAFGSLWIMYNLDYHHGSDAIPPTETSKYIIDDEGIKR